MEKMSWSNELKLLVKNGDKLLTTAELEVLKVIVANSIDKGKLVVEDLTTRQMAVKLNASHTAIARLLDKLEKKGVILIIPDRDRTKPNKYKIAI